MIELACRRRRTGPRRGVSVSLTSILRVISTDGELVYLVLGLSEVLMLVRILLSLGLGRKGSDTYVSRRSYGMEIGWMSMLQSRPVAFALSQSVGRSRKPECFMYVRAG